MTFNIALVIDRLSTRLRVEEKLMLRLYRCSAGKISIGYGRNLEDRGISEAEANYLLQNDINEILPECQQQDWWPAVADDEIRASVMLDMAFNMGLPRLSGFIQMLRAVRAHEWGDAAAEMRDSKWFHEVGSRAEHLAHMMETGKE